MFNFARVAAAKFVVKTLLSGLWNKEEGTVSYSEKTGKVTISFKLDKAQYDFVEKFVSETIGLK